MTKRAKIFFSAIILGLVITGAAFLRWPIEPAYLRFGSFNLKVLSWEVEQGTNVMFATDYRFNQWYRRQFDKVGIHLQGSRVNSTQNLLTDFNHDKRCHVLKLLCETTSDFESIAKDSAEMLSILNVHYSQGGEETFRVAGWGASRGPSGKVWFYWIYDPSEQNTLIPRLDSRTGLTNLCPRQFRIIRKSDNQELLHLNLADGDKIR